VTREHIEVTVQILDVNGQVGRRLGAVDQDRNIPGVRQCYNCFHGIDGAEGVGEMNQSNEPSSIC
jgi:hypothetical protein